MQEASAILTVHVDNFRVANRELDGLLYPSPSGRMYPPWAANVSNGRFTSTRKRTGRE
jgi:hypothetical protein